MNRQGRLVILELKAGEDIHLPLQALDYWMTIRRHQERGDFERLGYFREQEMSPEPPLILLVSPGLQFHAKVDTVLKYLSLEIRVERVGLNEQWRERLQVVFRLRGGQPADR